MILKENGCRSVKVAGQLSAEQTHACVDCRQVTLYLYNWMPDWASQLEKQLMRQILWHNARSHLVSCLSLQKMGLFHHLGFSDLPADNGSQVLNCDLVMLMLMPLIVRSQEDEPFTVVIRFHCSLQQFRNCYDVSVASIQNYEKCVNFQSVKLMYYHFLLLVTFRVSHR